MLERRRMRPNPTKPFCWLLALWVAGAAACGPSLTDTGDRASRVVLDFGSLLGGDFVSILDTAHLTITAGGESRRLTRLFGIGDSETTFDVSVKPGSATFSVDAMSTNGTLLYHGETTTTIAADGFALSITPQAVGPVMLIYPRQPAFDSATVQIGNFFFRDFTATVNVRNPGSATLTWHAEPPLPTGAVAVFCYVPFFEADCLQDITWPAATDLTVLVTIRMPLTTFALPAQGIRFVSPTGNATVLTAP
jgi:hypothetical protein